VCVARRVCWESGEHTQSVRMTNAWGGGGAVAKTTPKKAFDRPRAWFRLYSSTFQLTLR
jgi:hypothetical protein